jgi:hypothetical protein
MSILRLRREGVQWVEVDGQIIAVDGHTSIYLAANKSGALLWQALAGGSTRAKLVSTLVETYGLQAEAARADVDRFLAELAESDLLEA